MMYLFLPILSCLIPSVFSSPISLAVVDMNSCMSGLYFNDTTNQCENCLECPVGFQPNAPCTQSATGTKCETCPLDYYSDSKSTRMCMKHKICSASGKQTHAPGAASYDVTCGHCLEGYGKLQADWGNEEASCYECKIMSAPHPPECKDYVEDFTNAGTMPPIDPKDKEETATKSPDDSRSDDDDGDDSNPPPVTSSSALDSQLVSVVAVAVGLVCVAGIIIIVVLCAIHLWPAGGLCHNNGIVGTLRVKKRPEKRTVVLPEIIVAQAPAPHMVMYSRQLSDTVVQLKQFQLQPPDIVSNATMNTSDDDLVNLLAARSPVDQLKWRVNMVERIFKDMETWKLSPDVKSNIMKLFSNLDQYTQVQTGRALVDVFKPDVGSKITMDDLVKAVLNNPDTKVYDFVSCVHVNCVDSRLVEYLCDELFNSRKKSPALEPISESNA